MKVLAFGDLHGKLPKNLKQIIKKEKIELIICVGEIPNVPFPVKKGEFRKDVNLRFSKHYKKILSKLNSFKIPVFILRGNETGKGTIKLIRKFRNIKYKNIGKEYLKKKNFIFFDMVWEKWAYKWLPKNFLDKKTKNNKLKEKKLNKLLKE